VQLPLAYSASPLLSPRSCILHFHFRTPHVQFCLAEVTNHRFKPVLPEKNPGPIIIPTFRYYYSRMKKYHLGEFEEVVILTVGILNNEAYSVAIKDEIESRLSRSVSMGALHTALKRMEDKGYLKSYAGDSTDDRAGRPKRYFEITAMGKRAMRYTKETREELWRAIPKTVFEIKLAE
jgi:PadR family transcriptional regulator, regulatory protein PadR